MKLKDLDKLEFGKEHRGELMQDVPPDYLLWVYDNVTAYSEYTRALMVYIDENRKGLEQEAEDLRVLRSEEE